MAIPSYFLILATILFSNVSLSVRAWVLQDTIDVNTWQQLMRVDTHATNSEYVNYLSKDDALAQGLIKNQNGKLRLDVDSNTWVDSSIPTPANGGPGGRKSVRLQTNKQYNAGTLIIGDFDHIPVNKCGVWPSFWLVGPTWPIDGEIDIIEGVNEMPQNQITIHSKPGCAPAKGPEGETGARTGRNDCGENNGDIGCGVFNTSPAGWGAGFNQAGGGVYAMLWTNDTIKVWHWTAGTSPLNARSAQPRPEGWGPPVANWVGCQFQNFFGKMNLIVNTAFCGNWAAADAVWKTGSCASKGQCQDWVAWNPNEFKEAYWLINSIKVFSQ
ncbi:hypothetical protein EJ08DRAFT_699133 [Tothia fuscella]|uniref:GH16 domain-containing protein n=1 Tax=Tothia fuscella TaxID=1048955 RepID=A0A9P4NNK8_9PEZI|nr:hypothetical protein EJ08DRAFT_699133 [Tothia fuscella]